MIDVTILYPRAEGSTFDTDYYATKHMPMLADALGDACVRWGVTSIPAGDYHAIGWARIESQEAFNSAMAEKGAEIQGDIVNYTNVRPAIIIGDVVV